MTSRPFQRELDEEAVQAEHDLSAAWLRVGRTNNKRDAKDAWMAMIDASIASVKADRRAGERAVNECLLCGAPGGWLHCNRDCEEADQSEEGQ